MQLFDHSEWSMYTTYEGFFTTNVASSFNGCHDVSPWAKPRTCFGSPRHQYHRGYSGWLQRTQHQSSTLPPTTHGIMQHTKRHGWGFLLRKEATSSNKYWEENGTLHNVMSLIFVVSSWPSGSLPWCPSTATSMGYFLEKILANCRCVFDNVLLWLVSPSLPLSLFSTSISLSSGYGSTPSQLDARTEQDFRLGSGWGCEAAYFRVFFKYEKGLDPNWTNPTKLMAPSTSHIG